MAGTRREVSLGEMKLEREVGGKFQIALQAVVRKILGEGGLRGWGRILKQGRMMMDFLL